MNPHHLKKYQPLVLDISKRGKEGKSKVVVTPPEVGHGCFEPALIAVDVLGFDSAEFLSQSVSVTDPLHPDATNSKADLITPDTGINFLARGSGKKEQEQLLKGIRAN